MKYDYCTCFWCGKNVEKKRAFYSLDTDTLQTQRNFCSEEHLRLFREYMVEQEKKDKPIVPYVGKEV